MEKNTMNGLIGQIAGDYRQGDDSYVTNNYNFAERKNKAQFEDLTLNKEFFNDYPTPSFKEEIQNKIHSHQLLLVGGNYSFNKGMFLKYIALQIKEEDQEIKECTNFHNFY